MTKRFVDGPQNPLHRSIPIRNVGGNVAVFTAAYLLDLAGLLDCQARLHVDEVGRHVGGNWPQLVESLYGFNRTVIKNIFGSLRRHFSALDTVAFLLRGFDVPKPTELVETLLANGRNRVV